LWSLGTFKTHFFKGRACEISIQGLLLLPDLHFAAHLSPHSLLYKQDYKQLFGTLIFPVVTLITWEN
jgi:hypothetical protein